jgi:hypothetical protein
MPAAPRSAHATPTSPRAHPHASTAQRSRRDGSACSTRRRRPCRCAAASGSRSRGRHLGSAPSRRATFGPSGHTDKPSPSPASAPAAQRSRDRKALDVAIVARQRGRATALLNTSLQGGHVRKRYSACTTRPRPGRAAGWCDSGGGARRATRRRCNREHHSRSALCWRCASVRVV